MIERIIAMNKQSEDIKLSLPMSDGMLRRVGEASEMALDERIKYQKETMNNFIKYKGKGGRKL